MSNTVRSNSTLNIFSGLDQESLIELDKQCIKNKYDKGQLIFIQGNMSFGIYIIISGKVKILATGKDGKETILCLSSPGDVLGHCNIFTNEVYSGTAVTQEDCIISFMEKEHFLRAIEKYPKITLNLISQLSNSVGHYELKNIALTQKNVRERFAGLLITFKNTDGVKVGDHTRLDIKLTREEMASMIGTTHETLARLMTEFKNEGILEVKDRIIFIVNEEKLLEFANI
jgi:CRP-like cAMP-binding protein